MAVTTSSGDGYALYNGNKLPNINTVWTDKATLPYGQIFTFAPSAYPDTYALILSELGLSVLDGSYKYLNGVRKAVYVLTLSESVSSSQSFPLGEWAFLYDETDASLVPDDMGLSLIWSNHNIAEDANDTPLNPDDDTVVFSASDPIPLDGYNVIEWDGDTNGLVTFNGYHKVSNFVEKPSSAYSVYSNLNNVLEINDVVTDRSAYGDGAWSIYASSNNSSTAVLSLSDSNSISAEQGLYFGKASNGPYTKLLAYRSTETPPDEGGGYEKTAFLSGLAMGLTGKGDPTSDMAVSGGGANGNYLYNGVELPDINAVWTDKTTFPYAFITDDVGTHLLYLLSIAPAKGDHGEVFVDVYVHDGGIWVLELDDAYMYMADDEMSELLDISIWTSHDILNEDGSVYLAASDPVPAGGTDAFLKGYLTGAELRRKRVIPASSGSRNRVIWEGYDANNAPTGTAVERVSDLTPTGEELLGGYLKFVLRNSADAEGEIYIVPILGYITREGEEKWADGVDFDNITFNGEPFNFFVITHQGGTYNDFNLIVETVDNSYSNETIVVVDADDGTEEENGIYFWTNAAYAQSNIYYPIELSWGN